MKRPRDCSRGLVVCGTGPRAAPGNSLVFGIPGQECRRELGLGPVVVAAAFALAAGLPITATLATVSARAAVVALAPGSTVFARSTIFTRTPITVAVLAAGATIAASATIAIAAAVTATVAARSPIAAFTRLARRAGVGKLFPRLLVDEAHRQAHLPALVDLEQLDLHLLAFAQNVADVLDPLVLDLGHVNQPVLAGHEGHERAEVDDARHLAGVDGAGLGLGDDAADPLARGLDLGD